MRKYSSILLAIFIFASCAGNKVNKNQIYGTWHLNNVETNQQIGNTKDYQKALKQLIKTTIIEFNKDNTFKGTIWGDTTYGYWSTIGDTLIVKDLSNKKDFNVKIKYLNNGKMVLEEKSGKVVQTLTFGF